LARIGVLIVARRDRVEGTSCWGAGFGVSPSYAKEKLMSRKIKLLPLAALLCLGLVTQAIAGSLFGVDNDVNQSLRINSTDSVGTGIGSAEQLSGEGFHSVQGLAFDPNTNTLYGVDANIDQLININTTTGVATVVREAGQLSDDGFGLVHSLAFDPNTNTLYGVDFGADQLVSIDTSTGIASPRRKNGNGAKLLRRDASGGPRRWSAWWQPARSR